MEDLPQITLVDSPADFNDPTIYVDKATGPEPLGQVTYFKLQGPFPSDPEELKALLQSVLQQGNQ